MNRVLPVLLLVVSMLFARNAVAAPPTDASIQAAIEGFTPLWAAPRGELAGWVIALDPGDEAPAATAPRLDDDLSLLTGGLLYHFVHEARAGAILLRSDDTLSTDSGRDRRDQRFDVTRGRDCDVCVVLRYAPDRTEPAVSPLGERATDVQLSADLAAALNVPLQTGARAGLTVDASVAAAICCVELPRPGAASAIDVPMRRACFENARRIYGGIRAYCAAAKTARPTPVRSPADADGDTPNVRGPATSVGRTLWPAGRLPSAQADWFCDLFGRVSITARSLVYFDVTATGDEGITIRGNTNVPRLALGLEEALHDAGIEQVRNEIRALPDREQLGERLFGACRAPMALTYMKPGNAGGRQTQILFGEPLFLLTRRDGCYLLLAGDGYWGWVDETAVEPLTADQFDAYVRHPVAVLLRDITAQEVFVPRGARVRLAETGADPRILLPAGGALAAPADALRIDTPEEGAQRRVAAALELLYVPYVFGARSPLGVDCSGLVTSAWMRDGRTPARDVWQQAFAGELVATAWHRTNIRAGDQLFFIRDSGKLYHTAIALDATHFVHSSPPCVLISSFDPHDPLYEEEYERYFFMAKRP